MMRMFTWIALLVGTMCAQADDGIEFFPYQHASFVIKTKDVVIYVDPVGKAAPYLQHGKPDLILVTHAHFDHYSKGLLSNFKNAKLVCPKVIQTKLGHGSVLGNGDKMTYKQIKIEAIAMYNTSKDRLKYHPKGVGNGYVLTINDKRVYIAGDTEDIPEMRALQNIDYAFVCMNLPYTMTEKQAADAVLAFKPKVVFPYHYRGRNGFSDLKKFKELVSKNPEIQVRSLDWYPYQNKTTGE